MSLPTAILLSSCVIAFVILFGFTKDRWPWKKISLALGGLLILIIAVVVGGLWWMDRSQEKDRQEREERARELQKVEIGDRYERVIQRQGVPDTVVVREDSTFVLGYWDDYKSVRDVEKLFAFGPDSLLTAFEFIGDRYTSIEGGWTAEDGVGLGTPRDSVEARLGQPCQEDVGERRTELRFEGNRPGVTRYVEIAHGEGIVVTHGWDDDGCKG